MPIMPWLLYADHEVVPICRSLTPEAAERIGKCCSTRPAASLAGRLTSFLIVPTWFVRDELVRIELLILLAQVWDLYWWIPSWEVEIYRDRATRLVGLSKQ